MKFSIAIIRFYQRRLSRYTGRCRYYPTCSQYAILAIKKYGVIRGIIKTARRLKRCRPSNLESCIDFP